MASPQAGRGLTAGHSENYTAVICPQCGQRLWITSFTQSFGLCALQSVLNRRSVGLNLLANLNRGARVAACRCGDSALARSPSALGVSLIFRRASVSRRLRWRQGGEHEIVNELGLSHVGPSWC